MSSDPGQGYLAPAAEAVAELREKGSRFLAFVLPAADEGAARSARAGLADRYPNATHHCWAERLGNPARERASDDGEPSGTAGRPILAVLAGAGLSDVTAVVVRWFGGTKLGKGGLARAYSGATRLALDELETVERVPVETLSVEVSYSAVGAVKRLVHPPEVALVDERYGETAELVLVVWVSKRAELDESLRALGARLRA